MIRYKTLIALLLLTIIAGVPRFYGLSNPQIETDEHTGLMMCQMPVRDVWKQVVGFDSHPPLFYMILKSSSTMIEDQIMAMRIPSAIFGTLTIPAVWFMCHRSLGNNLAFIASGIIAFNPLHIAASQNGRMYVMLSLFAALATGLFVEIIANSKSRLFHLLFILTISAGIYTHYVFWTIPATLILWLMLYKNYLTKGKFNSGMLTLLFACLTFIPWPFILAYNDASKALVGRIGIFFKLTIPSIVLQTSQLLTGGYRPASEILDWLNVAILMFIFFLAMKKSKAPQARLLPMLFIIPWLLHLFVSVILKIRYDSTVFVSRYMTALLPGIAAVIAMSLHDFTACITKRNIQSTMLLLFMTVIISAQIRGVTSYYLKDARPVMQEAIDMIKKLGYKDDFVLLSGVLSVPYFRCYEKEGLFKAYSPGYWNPLHTFISPGEYKGRALTDNELISALESMENDLRYDLERSGIWTYRRIWFIEEMGLDPYNSPRDRKMRKILEERVFGPILEVPFEQAGVLISLWEVKSDDN